MSKIPIDPNELTKIKNIINSSNDDAKAELLKKINSKITDNPTKYSLLISKWDSFIKYFFSPKTPIKNKIYILAGLAYLIAPINLPGPVDDLLVLPMLMSFIIKEIDKLENGDYDKSDSQNNDSELQPISFDTKTNYSIIEINSQSTPNFNDKFNINPFETGTQY